MTDRTVSKTVCILLESDQELMADVHKHIQILENELTHKVLERDDRPIMMLCLSVQLVTSV